MIKWDRSLLQNVSRFLLQNATVITKCDVYYKLHRIATAYLGLRFSSFFDRQKKRRKQFGGENGYSSIF